MPIDITQCVFNEATRFAVVIVVATVGATETVITQQAEDLESQVGDYYRLYPPDTEYANSQTYRCN